MKKKFVVQNEQGLYWYGHYTNKNWTNNISEAKFFDCKSEVNSFMNEVDEKFLIAIKVWIKGV